MVFGWVYTSWTSFLFRRFLHSKMVLSVLKIGQSDIVLLYSVLDYFFSDQLRMGSWCASWCYPTNLHYVDFAVSNFSHYIHLLARAPCKNGPSEKKKGGQRTFFHRALHYYFSLHLVSPAQRLRGAILWPWKIWENFLVLWFIHIFKTVHLQHWVKSDAKS